MFRSPAFVRHSRNLRRQHTLACRLAAVMKSPKMISRFFRKIMGSQSLGRYALIGTSGIGIDLGVFTLLLLNGFAAIPANVVSSIFGITNNYFLNARLNFLQKVTLFSGLRFFSIGLAGLGLTTVSLHFFILAGMSPVVSKILILPALLAAQFLANRAWTFGRLGDILVDSLGAHRSRALRDCPANSSATVLWHERFVIPKKRGTRVAQR